MPAERDGEPVVLKIGIPDREGEFEAEALRRLDGNGAVRLLDDDPETRTMLLERCLPGTPLTEQDPDAALDVLIGLLPRLWIPAGEPFRPLAAEAADLIVEMREHWVRTGRSVDEALIDAAAEAFEYLAPTAGRPGAGEPGPACRQRARGRARAVAADRPQAARGGAGVRGGLDRARPRAGAQPRGLLHRLDRLSDELELDRERVRLWTIAHTVSWAFDDEPLASHVEAASWLLDAA